MRLYQYTIDCQVFISHGIYLGSVPLRLASRGVTIRVPHDTIRISIQRSRYNTYLDTYLNTVRCQRDVMSSMKAETPVIRSPAHNLLLQWMEYLLLQLPMLSQDVTLMSYIRVFPSIWSETRDLSVYQASWIVRLWSLHFSHKGNWA